MSESREKARRRAARLAKPAPHKSWFTRLRLVILGAVNEVRYR